MLEGWTQPSHKFVRSHEHQHQHQPSPNKVVLIYTSARLRLGAFRVSLHAIYVHVYKYICTQWTRITAKCTFHIASRIVCLLECLICTRLRSDLIRPHSPLREHSSLRDRDREFWWVSSCKSSFVLIALSPRYIITPGESTVTIIAAAEHIYKTAVVSIRHRHERNNTLRAMAQYKWNDTLWVHKSILRMRPITCHTKT